ncbi:G/U mismatch-specific DNA glycosylase [Chloroflexia bacterium SDU3-3]|nr:G/U mismatch-specific DNA glycosylase [Chloroflexia bacterium SDU3-3]
MAKRSTPRAHELQAAAGKGTSDIIQPHLWVLFCGINPGLYSAITGNHFARPGNRFWPSLHRSGFTPRQLHPSEEHELLDYGLGITNIAARTTATAAELSPAEIVAGGEALRAKVAQYQPRALAVLGITAYRTAFQQPKAQLGRQPQPLGDTLVWVLPNPSGLNAHYTPAALAEVFGLFRQELTAAIGPYQP